MDTLRFAVVGLGARGAVLAKVVQDKATVEVVCDADESRAKRMQDDLEAAGCCTDYRQAVSRKDVDAVIVAVPPGLHRDVVVAAANAGKHIFCEKPLAVELEHADEMLAAADRAGVVFMVGYQERYADDRETVRELVLDGAVGRPVLWREVLPLYPEAQAWLGDPDLGGGAIFEYSHSIDFACYVFGPPKSVTAALFKFNPDPNWRSHDTYTCQITFQSGDVFHISGFGCLPMGMDRDLSWGGDHRVVYPNDIVGQHGAIYMGDDGRGGRHMVLTRDPGTADHEVTTYPWSGWAGYATDPTPVMVSDFIDAIRSGGRRTRCDAREARQTLAILQGCLESSRTGRTVEL